MAGFEPAIPASQWPQIHVLDRAATVTGRLYIHSLGYVATKSY